MFSLDLLAVLAQGVVVVHVPMGWGVLGTVRVKRFVGRLGLLEFALERLRVGLSATAEPGKKADNTRPPYRGTGWPRVTTCFEARL